MHCREYTSSIISRWYDKKNEALSLRTSGKSIGEIERKFGIPRSTLSGWFKNIILTEKQKHTLTEKAIKGLIKARVAAIKWHHSQKSQRIKEAKLHAQNVLSKVAFTDKATLELALSILYLGEGAKTTLTSLGSSDPLILKFFIKSLKILFNVQISDLKGELHLRSDQSSTGMIKYWSEQLNIPIDRFWAIKDKRIVKSKTYSTYKGVCVIRCGRIAIQRRLIFLSKEFCNIISATDP